jgi:hypothetical protein
VESTNIQPRHTITPYCKDISRHRHHLFFLRRQAKIPPPLKNIFAVEKKIFPRREKKIARN